jgi:hypothetical protein
VDDTIQNNALTLGKDQPKGIVVLPGCQVVVLEYKDDVVLSDGGGKSNDEIEAENGKLGLERERNVPVRSIEDICKELISILKQINGMLEYETRTYLVNALSQPERDGIERHRTLMHADLSYIVTYFDYMDKLDVLVERAKEITQSSRIRNKLNGILQAYRDVKRRPKFESQIFVRRPKADFVGFDVFLCHNSEDKPAVKVIGEQLKERDLHPWLDEWELRPGFLGQKELEKQIENIRSAAVFVGPNGIGPWQDMEIDAFLRQFVRRSLPVIPVILPGCEKIPELPPFLGGMTWVDFRRDDPSPLQRLIWGITGKKR